MKVTVFCIMAMALIGVAVHSIPEDEGIAEVLEPVVAAPIKLPTKEPVKLVLAECNGLGHSIGCYMSNVGDVVARACIVLKFKCTRSNGKKWTHYTTERMCSIFLMPMRTHGKAGRYWIYSDDWQLNGERVDRHTAGETCILTGASDYEVHDVDSYADQLLEDPRKDWQVFRD